jgi:hypothetical protein
MLEQPHSSYKTQGFKHALMQELLTGRIRLI